MRLIVGLGNPGRRYRGTRHNTGREVVERFAETHRIAIDTEEGWADVGRGVLDRERVLVARPQTYMNESGAAVADLRGRHRIPHAHVMIVYDELDLPLGTLRIRERGSHGGHNGLRDVIDALGTSNVPRLRVGIGRPPAGVDPMDYVLERPSAEERAVLDEAVEAAAHGLHLWITESLQAAMRFCNTKRLATSSDRDHAPRYNDAT
jgi:peptidyl-tRNA hydrolase, PTH1 family